MDKYEITVNTFDKLADKYQAKYMDFDFYEDTYDTFCDLVTTKNAEIFELACGPENITQYLLNKRADFRIHGTDLAPNMVELAKNNNPTATFEVMDSRKISVVNKQFDAIMCGFCLPYLTKDDCVKLIKDCRVLLRKKGIIYISTMEDDDIRSGFQTSSAGDQVFIHYHQLEQLESALLKNDFEIIKICRKQFPLDGSTPTTDLFIYAKAV